MARIWTAAVLTLGLCGSAGAQQMSTAQEAAYQALWQTTYDRQAAYAAGPLSAAERAFAAVLALVESGRPGEALTKAAALHNLAAVRADLGRLPEAEAVAREALLLRRDHGAVANAIATSERLLATILNDLGARAEAMALLDSVVHAKLGNPEVDATLPERDFAALAVMSAETGNTEAATAMLAQMEPYLPGMTAPQQAAVYTALGRVQSLSGRPDLAEAAYRQVVGLTAAFPPGPDWTLTDHATALGSLATMLQRHGRPAEAAPLFRQALAMLDAGEGGAPVRANLLVGLGKALHSLGDVQAAFDGQRAGLDMQLAVLPDGHADLAATFATLGETLLQAGDAASAADALRHAVAVAEAASDDLRAARAAMTLAVAEAALGQPSFPAAEAARARLANLLPAGHPELVRAGFNTAWLALA